jgi:hypothetical protein
MIPNGVKKQVEALPALGEIFLGVINDLICAE